MAHKSDMALQKTASSSLANKAKLDEISSMSRVSQVILSTCFI